MKKAFGLIILLATLSSIALATYFALIDEWDMATFFLVWVVIFGNNNERLSNFLKGER
jgi:hypothetical protein